MGTVLLEPGLLDEFIRDAVREYEACTPQLPPRCWAVLVGRLEEDAMRVVRVRYARNVREVDAGVLQEFEDTVVPCFGAAYCNGRRGFWCDAKDLLRITREAEAAGLEVLGSIHLHPDWHRIGPPQERGLKVSQEPTPMDRHMFRNTSWPLNMILYLERREGVLYHSLGAWTPPRGEEPESRCEPLTVRISIPPRLSATG
jgi:proteasome lid subunit RPN8/RPN11